MRISTLSMAAFAAFAFTGVAHAAAADPVKDYPNRPLRLLVPNAPGSAVDTLSRIVATSSRT
jgi:tripartite-type tricarboxylate transporter receptor subunit TctC